MASSTVARLVEIVTVVSLLYSMDCHGAIDHDRLYGTIMKGYNKKTLPTLELGTVTNVSIDLEITSVNNFDELSGKLSMSVLFSIVWKEERINWNISDTIGIKSLLVEPDDIWRPYIYILQPSDRMVRIGNSSSLLRVFNRGDVVWVPADLINLACSVDVTYFPFDTQRCLMTLSGWSYDRGELFLYSPSKFLHSSYYKTHSQWKLLHSPIVNGTLGGEDQGPTCVNVTFTLQRRSEFFIVYLINPLVFLGLINTLLFIMPASSGERSSVAITTFLSFVVYLSIIDDIVPESSAPIAYLYYYVLFLMLYSSFILFLCIVSLHIYDKEGEVPAVLHKLLFCVWQSPSAENKKEIQMKSIDETDIGIERTEATETNVETNHNSQERVNEKERNMNYITWKRVGKVFDKICFGVLMITFIATTTSSFAFIYYNSGREGSSGAVDSSASQRD